MTPRGFTAPEVQRRARAVSTPIEQIIDRIVGVFSPRQATIRRHRRLMERDGEYKDSWFQLMEMRGYKAAQSPTNGTPWLHSTIRSADAELIPDLPTLRARNRQLERDDALAAGLFATRRRQVIGTGLRPQATTDSEDLNNRMEEVFAERADELFQGEALDFGAGQRMIYTRKIVDGDVLVVRTKTRRDEPVWFEVVEGDRVETPLDSYPEDPEGRIVNGVEKDRHGRVVAYWVAKRHPGEVQWHKTAGRPPKPVALTKDDFVRIPRERARFVRNEVSRPGQSRGVPLLHSTMQDFLDLDLLTLSVLKRSQIAACLALFIESDQSVADLFQVTSEDYGYQLDQQLEPGMIFKLYPGERVTGINPAMAVPDIEPMQSAMARRIAAAAEMSPESILKLWGHTNYSSARTVQLEDNRMFDTERRDFAAQLLDWMWSEVLLDALLRGDERMRGVTLADIRRVRWVGDARPWVDPAAEAEAVSLRLQLGLTTLRDEAEALGKDWEENLRQQAREKELREELGLATPEEAKKAQAEKAAEKAADQPADGKGKGTAGRVVRLYQVDRPAPEAPALGSRRRRGHLRAWA